MLEVMIPAALQPSDIELSGWEGSGEGSGKGSQKGSQKVSQKGS